MDAPGRPTMYRTTKDFLKMFGMTSLEELPELPRYKIDENEQIVIDDVIEEAASKEAVKEETKEENVDKENSGAEE